MSDRIQANGSSRPQPIIKVRNLSKAFENGRIPAIQDANLEVARGELLAIMGPSGCGKSTLLHLIAALDRPDAGTVEVEGEDLFEQRDLNRHRSRTVGIVFQLHHLLPTLTASENVQVPMMGTGPGNRERRELAEALLDAVGIADKGSQLPASLSGGERQRVAVARALANDPPILLADEPTGSLDSVSGKRVLDLIQDLHRERGLTVVLVTHDQTVAARADRIVHMLDGRVYGVITHDESLTAESQRRLRPVSVITPSTTD
jgi:putative ABC transport system ATP-binding protein